MDANVRVSCMMDMHHVGNAVLHGEHQSSNYGRASVLLDFLGKHNLYLANTFADAPLEMLATRTAWCGHGESQIDFIAVSFDSYCLDTGVDQSLLFNTDHKLVWAVTSTDLPRVNVKKSSTPRNCKPDSSWT